MGQTWLRYIIQGTELSGDARALTLLKHFERVMTVRFVVMQFCRGITWNI
jgi:hypothetical protein